MGRDVRLEIKFTGFKIMRLPVIISEIGALQQAFWNSK
jgi:hypothetical protein